MRRDVEYSISSFAGVPKSLTWRKPPDEKADDSYQFQYRSVVLALATDRTS